MAENNSEKQSFPKIPVTNGLDRALAVTTNDRLERTILELQNTNQSLGELNTSIAKFHADSDKWSKSLVAFTVLLVVLTGVLIWLNVALIQDGHREIESQNNIALNAAFFNTVNTKIIGAIEGDEPILLENKGQFTDAQLDNYLGEYDNIESAYDEGLLSESDLCDSFSYYAQITSQNKEVEAYIASQQKIDPGFFASLADIPRIVANSKNRNCE